ncbi:type VI secretion system-associated protein [Rhodothermaceae bacterium RA]|nr:type VI secretion system-associated protein [Rhodothermaceae bacterium RA]
MSKSFQREKPPARINLFLEVQKGNAKEKVELPHRMMLMGDFKGREEETPVEDREVININKDNFDSVMKSMELELSYSVPDKLKGGDEEIPVHLKFENMNSFRPEEVARQVPQINRLVAMRNLLQDLRNRVVSLSQFRKQLEAIVQDPAQMEKLMQELDKVVKKEAPEEGGDG